jgi:ubiquinone/menaquinone biosynthesis C-methylase UbiE
MIPSQVEHPVLPRANHDEAARQEFAMALKRHLATKVAPSHRAVYDRRARAEFERTHVRTPNTRQDVLAALTHDSLFQVWGSLFRIGQELGWESVVASVERQKIDLVGAAKAVDRGLGSVELDPQLEIPDYLERMDFHAMPGGYHREFAEDDVSAGALFDRGAFVYVAGHSGPMGDLMGQTLSSFLKGAFPELRPVRILDIGCSVGHSTLPYLDAFPGAQVHAIDVSAPLIRYAHARAEGLGAKVHFAQGNAESTHFPDSYFDVVVSHILVHEIPLTAIRKVMTECHRLLRQDGVTAHIDLAFYQDLDVIDAALLDWDAHFASEPFWSVIREQDPRELLTAAGFAESTVFQRYLPRATSDSPMFRSQEVSAGRGTWSIFGATK